MRKHLPLLDPKKIYYNTLEAIGKPVGLCVRERADARSGHLGCSKQLNLFLLGVRRLRYLNRIQVAIS